MKNIIEVIGINNILMYLLIVNLLGFLAMGIDKWKAKHNMWRIPENTLFMFTILGGGIGTIAGMYIFRHKTKKIQFTVGMPAILVLEIILIIILWLK